MSGLISQFSGPVALPATIALPSANAPGGPSLAVFIDLMTGKAAMPAVVAVPNGDERQDDAAPGKSLPPKDKKIDPTLAWLFGAPPPAVPVTVTVPQSAAPVISAAPTVLPADRPAQPGDAGTAAEPVTAPAAELDLTAPSKGPDPLPGGNAPGPIAIAHGPASPAPLAVGDAPKAIAPSALVAPIAAPPLQSAPIILPALFALAMGADPRPADRDDTLSATPDSAGPQPLSTALAAIAQPGDAQRQSLDMGQRDWPQKMIDHIEALRDNANANDTSIRLKPEALGQVDVSLKTHENGAVSVRFTAEQPATRTLIADAAPQLAQAAEARGIRLSGTSVDLTGQGGDPRPRPEVERRQPITNHLTAPGSDDGEPVADGRVA